MAFAGWNREKFTHQVLFADELSNNNELRCFLYFQLEDSPVLPAEYPYPHPRLADNLGRGDRMQPFMEELMQIPAGAKIPATGGKIPPELSDLYSLPLAVSVFPVIELATESGDTLLCEQGRQRDSFGARWFIPAEPWYLVRMTQEAFRYDETRDSLNAETLYYVRGADLPAYEVDLQLKALLLKAVNANKAAIKVAANRANQTQPTLHGNVEAFWAAGPLA